MTLNAGGRCTADRFLLNLFAIRIAQGMIQDPFHPFDPLKVHEKFPAVKCPEILAALKPQFLHYPLSKECIRQILVELGCDLDKTVFDVPRIQASIEKCGWNSARIAFWQDLVLKFRLEGANRCRCCSTVNM